MKITKNISIKILSFTSLLCAGLCTLTSCDPSLTDAPGDGSLGNLLPAGETQIRYVSLGNSLTAGMQSLGVSSEFQMYSYPYLIGKQFGITMTQPNYANGGFYPEGKRYIEQITYVSGAASPVIKLTPQLLNFPVSPSGTAWNNLGVPGARITQFMDPNVRSLATAPAPLTNPYFLTTMGTDVSLGLTLVDQATKQNPNLMTLWAGNNDVLQYALSGGTFPLNGNPNDPGPTTEGVFSAAYNQIIDTISARLPKTKIVIGNIPDVRAIPAITTIPWNGLVLDAEKAGQLTAAYAQLNAAYKQVGADTLSFSVGANGFLVASNDPKLSVLPAQLPRLRHLKSGEFVILTGRDSIVAGQGSMRPIQNSYVLTTDEVAKVDAALSAYNTIIKNAVDKLNGKQAGTAALFNAYALFQSIASRDQWATDNGITLQTGYPLTGQTTDQATGKIYPNRLTTAYVSGGLFSLDGVHPTSKGYAVIANEMIKTINATWKSKIPTVSLELVPGVTIEGAK